MAPIAYRDSAAGITPDQLGGFLIGWPSPPDPVTHVRLLAHSDAVVLALDADTRSVVGFITAITDHVLAASVPHLEVLPAYQGQGIGSTLVRGMALRHDDRQAGAGAPLLTDQP
jgi:ribosomal protein S18 acetylase RimI-like enzyme